jgi:branched-chain amino acid transport system ATP-binding protein
MSNSTAAPLLEGRNLSFGYKGAVAVTDVSLFVRVGEAVALLGSNGAGKSTTVKIIAGALKPQRGRIQFAERDVTDLPSHRLVESGITLVPEGRLVFPRLSVLENLQIGAHAKRAKARYAANIERVFSLFPRLSERRNQLAGSMSGGEQQMVAIARGLMSDPRLLILDEPSLGLMPKMVDQLFAIIQTVRSTGISLIIVEQNVHQALEIVDRAYILTKGRITLEGTGHELLLSDIVRKSFLGL